MSERFRKCIVLSSRLDTIFARTFYGDSWIDESVIDLLLENFIKEMSSSLLECSTISIVEDYVSVGIFLRADLSILDKSATQWEYIRRILFWPMLQLRRNFCSNSKQVFYISLIFFVLATYRLKVRLFGKRKPYSSISWINSRG